MFIEVTFFADEMPKKPAINGWGHVVLYNGSGYIIEADPHIEKWDHYMKNHIQ